MYGSLYSSYYGHGDYYKRWIKPGDERTTTVPAMIYPGNGVADNYYKNSEVLVSKGDHIRLQDVSLAYKFGNTVLKKYSLKNLKVFAYINNSDSSVQFFDMSSLVRKFAYFLCK